MADIAVTNETLASIIAAMDEAGYSLTEACVACTDTTLAEWQERAGEADDSEQYGGHVVHIWNNFQVAKGRPRGDLVVVEVDGGTVTYHPDIRK